jgi:hypothetical protein
MPIIENQIKKLIADESIKTLRQGKTMDISHISRIISEKVRQLNGGPTLRLYLQEPNSKFNIEAYNLMMKDIKFDIDILYESMIEKAEEVMKQYNSSEVSYKSQQIQLATVSGVLDNLLFTVKNADDYFFGFFDTFSSLDKIDMNQTSVGLLDLAEGCAQLPYSTPSAKRHQLTHLTTMVNGNVQVRSLDNKSIRGRNGGNSIFGYAFSDINTIWRYEAITIGKNGAELIVTFPLNQNEEIARLTRVELAVPTGGGLTARLLLSLDGQNYIRPSQTSDKSILPETRKIAWDFPDTPARYVRVSVVKQSPDGEFTTNQSATQLASPVINIEQSNQSSSAFGINQSKEWLYSFNIAMISCYKIGRSLDGILVSKPLAFGDETDQSINYISIDTEEEVPASTSIDYEIALSDSEGNLTTSYIPINPVGRPDSDTPKVINFGKTTKDVVNLVVGENIGDYDSTLSSNGVDYYQPLISCLDPIAVASHTYKYGSCKLYRGGNLFSKTTNASEIVKEVRNCYIDFSDGKKTKPLYSVVSESGIGLSRYVSKAGIGVIPRTFIKTQHEIVVNTNPKPGLEDDVTTDVSPDYSIFKLERIPANVQVTGQSITPSGSTVSINGIQVPSSSTWTTTGSNQASYGVPILMNGQPIDILNTASDKPVLKYTSGSFTHVFRPGIDYSIKRSDDQYFNNFNNWQSSPIHWRIIGNNPAEFVTTSGSSLASQYGTGLITGYTSQMPPFNFTSSIQVPSNARLSIDYKLDTDITHRIVDVSPEEIELDTQIYIDPADSLLVTYKTRPDNIIKRTLRVKGTHNSSTNLLEGVDYTVDINNATISKVIGGGLDINPSQTCYVDYSYKAPINETISYSVWCYLDSREPVVFDFNKLPIRRVLGESFTWTYTEAGKPVSKELSDLETITLGRGWHYFTVNSLDPNLFSDAAITQVLKFRSIDGQYLFLRRNLGGTIFSRITGIRTAMRQVDYSFLIKSTLKSDHSTFAIKNNTNIINNIYTNFLPGTMDDFYMKKINSSGEIVDVTTEELIFEGIRNLEEESDQNQGYVVVRARLSRNNNSDGGITPKLHSYNLRVSY